VRSLRKAMGGKEPPSHIAIRELRLPVVKAEFLSCVPSSDPHLLDYICSWRHHVQKLDTSDAHWLSQRYWTNEALRLAILPETILFPRLTTLSIGSMTMLTSDIWQTLLEQCPLLVDFTHLGWHDPTMDVACVWRPRSARLNPWIGFVVASHTVQPEVMIEFANPHMRKIGFASRLGSGPSRKQALITPGFVQRLCDKWQGHGRRLKHLHLGKGCVGFGDMDELVTLLLSKFPELESLPWAASFRPVLLGSTIRDMYATWSCCDKMPPSWAFLRDNTGVAFTKTRTPQTEILAEEHSSFFSSWTTEQVLALVAENTQLEELTIRHRQDGKLLHEQQLCDIVARNPRLRRIDVTAIATVTDAFFQALPFSGFQNNAVSISLGGQSQPTECKASVSTLLKLISALSTCSPYRVAFCVGLLSSVTSADDLLEMARIMNEHRRRTFEFSVFKSVLVALLPKVSDGELFGLVVLPTGLSCPVTSILRENFGQQLPESATVVKIRISS
jgi:hypothetical protein